MGNYWSSCRKILFQKRMQNLCKNILIRINSCLQVLECLQEDFVKTFLQTTFWVATDQFWHKYCLKFCNMQKIGLQKWTGEQKIKWYGGQLFEFMQDDSFKKKLMQKYIDSRWFLKKSSCLQASIGNGEIHWPWYVLKYVNGLNTTQIWNL